MGRSVVAFGAAHLEPLGAFRSFDVLRGASNCVQCHRVGGVGGNPHPMGWTARHGTEEIDRSTMCLFCHR
jgi:hypothetical protein